jgi:putative addiction module component (TIGR02574 family)
VKRELVAEILELPVEERMRLVEAIWDSISAAPELLPLTEWQREELDRRLAEYEADRRVKLVVLAVAPRWC